jgi:hypothetical protein
MISPPIKWVADVLKDEMLIAAMAKYLNRRMGG